MVWFCQNNNIYVCSHASVSCPWQFMFLDRCAGCLWWKIVVNKRVGIQLGNLGNLLMPKMSSLKQRRSYLLMHQHVNRKDKFFETMKRLPLSTDMWKINIRNRKIFISEWISLFVYECPTKHHIWFFRNKGPRPSSISTKQNMSLTSYLIWLLS